MIRYPITQQTGLLPPKDKSLVKIVQVDGAITAMSLDQNAEEVILGTD